MEKLNNIVLETKATDATEKGIVTVAVNGIGIKDSDGDISGSGSFDDTLKDMSRTKWFLNHDKTKLLGCPTEGKEENGNLVMVGKINTKKQIGVETLSDYQLYAECGKTLEHSVGVRALVRDTKNKNLVKKWFMGEYSTLTHWGANPQTFLMDIKEMKGDDLKGHLDMMRKALNGRYSDEKLKALEGNLLIIEKALLGGSIVQCPHCGLAFDYATVPEESLESQVLEAAGDYARWMADDIVRAEMQKLKPEIQERVLAIIDQNKSLDDISSFVRCPKCYARIYRSNALFDDPADTPVVKGRGDCSVITLKSISKLII